VKTTTGQGLEAGDFIRTGRNSRAGIKWPDEITFRVGADTLVEILPPAESGLRILQGLLSFFHREKPGRIRILTRGSMAGVKGTEFVMKVEFQDNIERTTLFLVDGLVELRNDQNAILLTNGEQGVAETGKSPRKTAGFVVNNVLQWAFYYPAVLDVDDLPLTVQEQQDLADSIAAYRAGDLLAALDRYPAERQPVSDAKGVYYAALLLSVGEVESAQAALEVLSNDSSDELQRVARALRQLIATVKQQTAAPAADARLASEFLAASYYEQAQAEPDSLKIALGLARRATAASPEFGFAWARVAELEFSFGRIGRSLEALNRSLALSPRNAQALALKGFLFAAQNKTRDAIQWFNDAIAVDSALANAWLGRGLCRIRRGDRTGGREDLLIAAALEPQRSFLRSYLGKAYGDAGRRDLAAHELDLARQVDPADPTPWLYSALIRRDENRINESIAELERSRDLNENRRLYRSKLLLDQDRAVRGANLAAIYRDAGLFDWSVNEASRAVNSDYANSSAHLFLANSYNELRDPNLIQLRYETATFSEYLLANMLTPVGATPLSPYVSQQEYSRLFERDYLGVSSSTRYFSRGDWHQEGSQYGTLGNFGYALDAAYRSQRGQRPNNDLEQTALSGQFKLQLTPQDSIYSQAIYSDLSSGDTRQFYDQQSASRALRVTERQDPNLFAGYHREWSPGVHTLFLAARLSDNFVLSDSNILIRGVLRDRPGGIVTNTVEQFCRSIGIDPATACDAFDSLKLRSEFQAYSAELQQIAQISQHSLVVGGRYQDGEATTRTKQTRAFGRYPPYTAEFDDFVASQKNSADLTRLSFYAYDQWRVVDSLQVTAGLTYDRLDYPQNIDLAPISSEERTREQFSPKAGFIWTPASTTTFRGAYSRSLGGLFYDASVRLEPVQIAGFNQAYRSLIPESVEGAIAGSRFQTFDLGVEHRLKWGTYLGVQAELLQSDADRDVGVFDVDLSADTAAAASQIRQDLEYEEQSLVFSVNQLLGRDWSLGARYKLTQAELETDFHNIANAVAPDSRNRAVLNQLNLFGIYNHPSGFFAQAQSLWTAQRNHHYDPDIPGDDFWQFNLFAGYRFPRRRAELTFGLLNLTDQDYRLNPLNLYLELPRQRTLLVSLRFNF
jgi:Tfp pilus assembly protein PilF